MSVHPDALDRLRALVRPYPSALLGYSGGVDSTLLAVVLRQELGRDRMVAAIGRSPSYPTAQWETALLVAARFDVPVIEIETHELDDPSYVANPTNRCFFCKTELWARLVPEAHARALAVVCDGTNADDLVEHRPGRAAGLTAGVRSPLAETGLGKAEVREAAQYLGVPIWDAPAAPCLSSRIQYGLGITPSRLRQVEQGETYLRALGLTGDLRVRHLGDLARIEAEPRWIPWLQARAREITVRLTELGFTRVEIDLRGYRRGSLLRESAVGP
jgi:uncharacterized protein